ncbi:MAG: hypothetical protein ACRDP6_50230 [Actinoallomurus sp.]
MTDKFRADPARADEAVASMEGLRDLVYDMFSRLDDSLENGQKILGHDEFGISAGRQLAQQRLQLHQAGMALAQVFGAVPEMLRSQQRYVKKSQLGVIDAIHQSGAGQGEMPGKGGKSGKY